MLQVACQSNFMCIKTQATWYQVSWSQQNYEESVHYSTPLSPPPPFTFWGATQGSWDICGMYAGNAGESGWSQIFVENIIQQVITDYAICIPYCEFLDLYFPEIITFRLQLTYYQFYQMVWRAAEAFSFSIYMPMSGDCSTVNDLYRASSNGPKFSYYSFILRAF